MKNKARWPLFILRVRITLLFLALSVAFLMAVHFGMAGAAAVTDPQDVDPTGARAEESAGEAAILDETIRGLLLSIPQGLIGEWEVRTGHEQSEKLLVVDLSLLDGNLLQLLQGGLPASNTWVYAKVQLQVGGIGLVTQIRLDNYEPGEVAARLETDVLSSTIASRYNLTPKSTLLRSGNIHLFTTSEEDDSLKALVQAMSEDDDIAWAELNYRGEAPEANPYRTWGWGGPEPTGYVNQMAFEQVNLPPALEQYQGDNIVVAILDTGVDLNHPALVGRLEPGIDLVEDNDDPQDEGPGMGWGHGTHVAGIIARMAPNSRLLPVRVLDHDGQGNVFTLAYGVEWAVDQGAKVINLSLGIEEENKTLADVLADAQKQGVVVVAAAGNDNSNEMQYPIGYEGVIGVTAVTADNQKAGFGNYGPWVDLAAPGVGITSTMIGPDPEDPNSVQSGYASWRGTSMATAFVSGAAALVQQKYPLSSTVEIASLLTNTAQNLDAANPEFAGQLGGLLDTGAAVANQPSPPATPVATATPPQSPTPPPVETPTPGATPAETQIPTPTPTLIPGATPTPTQGAPGAQNSVLYLPIVGR